MAEKPRKTQMTELVDRNANPSCGKHSAPSQPVNDKTRRQALEQRKSDDRECQADGYYRDVDQVGEKKVVHRRCVGLVERGREAGHRSVERSLAWLATPIRCQGETFACGFKGAAGDNHRIGVAHGKRVEQAKRHHAFEARARGSEQLRDSCYAIFEPRLSRGRDDDTVRVGQNRSLLGFSVQ